MSAKSIKKLRLGYCPIGNGDSIAPFDRVFGEKQDISKEGFEGVDAVIFWGGTDIHPSLYDQQRHMSSQAGHVPSSRDTFEWRSMLYCKVNKIPMIGVCRGAQMLCAFAGGTLVQHMTGHQGGHMITTSDDEIFMSTSAHHQMMYPFDIPHQMLAVSSTKLSKLYEGNKNETIPGMANHPEPEVVYFPTVNGLAIQGHPEWAVGTRFADYCNELVLDLIINKEEVCA